MSLIERSNSVLVVIDVQDNFLNKLALHERSTLVSRIGWLMQVATVLAIPMIATAEDVSDEVDMCPSLKALLPSGQSIYNKLVFNLHGQDDIREALEKLDKRDVALVWAGNRRMYCPFCDRTVRCGLSGLCDRGCYRISLAASSGRTSPHGTGRCDYHQYQGHLFRVGSGRSECKGCRDKDQTRPATGGYSLVGDESSAYEPKVLLALFRCLTGWLVQLSSDTPGWVATVRAEETP